MVGKKEARTVMHDRAYVFKTLPDMLGLQMREDRLREQEVELHPLVFFEANITCRTDAQIGFLPR